MRQGTAAHGGPAVPFGRARCRVPARAQTRGANIGIQTFYPFVISVRLSNIKLDFSYFVVCTYFRKHFSSQHYGPVFDFKNRESKEKKINVITKIKV